MKRVAPLLAVIACLTPLMLPFPPALGSGFALLEQSAVGLGYGFAGTTADPEGPSATFYNPSALIDLQGTRVEVGLHVIRPSFKFSNQGSTFVQTGTPIQGGTGGDAGSVELVPNAYLSHSVNETVTAGLGITAPYGLITEYDDGWVGRYQALKSSLRTIDINPGVAIRLSDTLSVGLGVSAQYADAELTSAVDFGSITGVGPGLLDGRSRIEGDDWSYGYNVGLQYTPVPSTRLGVQYRSKIEHTVEGDATFEVPLPATPLQAMGLFVNTGGEADLNLPDVLSAGVAHDVTASLTLRADVSWTGWSSFEELRLKFDSNQPDSVTPEDWTDTWRVAAGASYALSDSWTCRAGLAFDESPVPGADRRTPRIPDTDRTWFTAGVGYQASEAVHLDVGYGFILFDEAPTRHVGATGDLLLGKYDGEVNILSVQLRTRI